MSYKSLSHSQWDCRYHIPKGRKKKLYGNIRKYLISVFKELARQKGCEIISGHYDLLCSLDTHGSKLTDSLRSSLN